MKKTLFISLIIAAMIFGSLAFYNVRATDNVLDNEIALLEPEEIEKELTEKITDLRDQILAKIAELESEYDLDLDEFKERVEEAVENYKTTVDFSLEDLETALQETYNDLVEYANNPEVQQELLEEIAKTYAKIRESIENNIDEIKNNVKETIDALKEEYPALAEVENVDDLVDLVYQKIGEYEDAILELVEAYQENPEETVEEVTAKVKEKISEAKTTAESMTKNIYNYVVNGETIKFDTLDGEGLEFNKENATDLTFRFNIYYPLFKKYGKVFVDDVLVSEENYTTKKGSTVVTLNKDYLNTLDNGNHTIKVALEYNNTFGEASANLTVAGPTEAEKANTSASPKTGDNITLYLVAMIIASCGLILSYKIKK